VIFRLGAGPDHGHHDSERADIQRPGNEMIFAARNADHRHQIEAATQRELVLERFELEPRVLHIVEHEFGAGIPADLRQAGREEFEDHSAARAAARRKSLFDWIVSHFFIAHPLEHTGHRWEDRSCTKQRRRAYLPMDVGAFGVPLAGGVPNRSGAALESPRCLSCWAFCSVAALPVSTIRERAPGSVLAPLVSLPAAAPVPALSEASLPLSELVAALLSGAGASPAFGAAVSTGALAPVAGPSLKVSSIESPRLRTSGSWPAALFADPAAVPRPVLSRGGETTTGMVGVVTLPGRRTTSFGGGILLDVCALVTLAAPNAQAIRVSFKFRFIATPSFGADCGARKALSGSAPPGDTGSAGAMMRRTYRHHHRSDSVFQGRTGRRQRRSWLTRLQCWLSRLAAAPSICGRASDYRLRVARQIVSPVKGMSM
jgi:hypothetical protein